MSDHVWNIFAEKATAAMPPPGIKPKVILDLGCWQGVTTEIYLIAFPEAKVIGVDPEIENVMAAEFLYDSYGSRVEIIRRAIWDKDCIINFHRGYHTMTGCVAGTMDNPSPVVEWVHGMPLDLIAEKYEIIDFIKMDIEGSEFSVLGAGGEWPKKTRSIAVEVHEENNEHCRELLEGLGFRIVHEIPELLWAVNDNA